TPSCVNCSSLVRFSSITYSCSDTFQCTDAPQNASSRGSASCHGCVTGTIAVPYEYSHSVCATPSSSSLVTRVGGSQPPPLNTITLPAGESRSAHASRATATPCAAA